MQITEKTDPRQATIHFSRDRSIKVWLQEKDFETWGRQPGHTYTLVEHNDDGSLKQVTRWRVTAQGERVVLPVKNGGSSWLLPNLFTGTA